MASVLERQAREVFSNVEVAYDFLRVSLKATS